METLMNLQQQDALADATASEEIRGRKLDIVINSLNVLNLTFMFLSLAMSELTHLFPVPSSWSRLSDLTELLRGGASNSVVAPPNNDVPEQHQQNNFVSFYLLKNIKYWLVICWFTVMSLIFKWINT